MKNIALGFSTGIAIGFGMVSLTMTLGYFLQHNVIIDYRYWLYMSTALIFTICALLINKQGA